MRVTANGKQVDLPDGATIADLVAALGLSVRSVVVERNGDAVARATYGGERLADGDRLEVVRAVQGGSGHKVREVLDACRLYLVAPARTSDDTLRAAAAHGATLVQLREKDAADAIQLSEGRRFAAAAAASGAAFVMNDRPDLAVQLGAFGVHVGQDDLPVEQARAAVGPDVAVGLSTHSREQIQEACRHYEAGHLDYIAVGPVFHTATHPSRPATGLELVTYAAAEVPFPWFAIGGIDPSTVRQVAEAGARRIVVVRAIVDASDPAAATRQLMQGLDAA